MKPSVPVQRETVDYTDGFEEYVRIFAGLGIALCDADLAKTLRAWISLDLPVQLAALADVRKRAVGEWSQCAVRYVTRPWNHLAERQWERKTFANGRQRSMTPGEEAQSEAARRFRNGPHAST
jgi:hypothetical protein